MNTTCPTCNGTRHVPRMQIGSTSLSLAYTCPDCHGTGQIPTEPTQYVFESATGPSTLFVSEIITSDTENPATSDEGNPSTAGHPFASGFDDECAVCGRPRAEHPKDTQNPAASASRSQAETNGDMSAFGEVPPNFTTPESMKPDRSSGLLQDHDTTKDTPQDWLDEVLDGLCELARNGEAHIGRPEAKAAINTHWEQSATIIRALDPDAYKALRSRWYNPQSKEDK